MRADDTGSCGKHGKSKQYIIKDKIMIKNWHSLMTCRSSVWFLCAKQCAMFGSTEHLSVWRAYRFQVLLPRCTDESFFWLASFFVNFCKETKSWVRFFLRAAIKEKNIYFGLIILLSSAFICLYLHQGKFFPWWYFICI